jgi:Homeodomain-like domain
MPSMIPTEIRSSVHVLKAQGQTLREISRLLKLSRNTVRRILRDGAAAAAPPASRRRWPGSRTPLRVHAATWPACSSCSPQRTICGFPTAP